MSNVSIYLFGQPLMKREGVSVEINRRKAIALAGYLALNQGPQSRDTLAALLWPERGQTNARNSLATSLNQLKKLFGFEFALNNREQVLIHPDLKLWVDVNQFKQIIVGYKAHQHPEKDLCPDCLDALTRAIELYRDDFMSGFFIPDNESFENWKRAQTEDLRQELLKVLRKLGHFHASRGEFEQSIHHARRWVKEDPLDETAHLYLMRLYAWSRQGTAALRQYEECKRILKKELDVEPQAGLSKLYTEIKEHRLSQTPPVLQGKPSSQGQIKTPCPPELCIGREKELAEIGALFEKEACRLLTLIGPGGIGKTVLALKIYFEIKARFRDGAFFVPLIYVDKTEFIIEALADTLGLRFHRETDRWEQVLRFLSEKQLLLILDNFEHLLDGVDLLAEILKQAAGVRLLVTSQQRLNLKEEWLFEVPGLDYPKEESTPDMEKHSAVRLFFEKAKRVRPRFVPTEEDRSAIAHICRYVEGLPLGIELAAGCLQAFSCREIAKEMEHGFDILSTTLRDVPERHRSLEALFERFWRLLTQAERQLMKKLSVFRGGFTRQAAEEVAQASLTALFFLVNKTFLQRKESERYEMPGLLREFVKTKARSSSKRVEEAQARHAEYFSRLMLQIESNLKTGRQKQALAEAIEEIGNIHKGWRWAVTGQRVDLMNRYLDGLFYFYELRGWFQLGEQALQDTLEALRSGQDSAREKAETRALVGKILSWLGLFRILLGKFDQAQTLLDESISIFKDLGLRKELGSALNRLGLLFFFIGRLEESGTYLNQGLAAFEEEQDQWGIASSYKNLGNIARLRGDLATAKKMFQKALTKYREWGDNYNISSVLTRLGLISEEEGYYKEATNLHRKSLEGYRETHEIWGWTRRANLLNNLGFARYGDGDYVEAEACFREALRGAIDIQARPILQEGLIGLAFIFGKNDENEKALEIVGHMVHSPPMPLQLKKRAEQLLEGLRTRFSEREFADLMESGKDRTLDYFIDLFKKGLL
jgi:DNA-binding SARP family transcriptional activator/Tfp pilus assembly protein PilF